MSFDLADSRPEVPVYAGCGYNVTTKPERKYVPETVLASEYQLNRSLREHKDPRNETFSQGERLS